MELKNSKTAENLKEAFHGESMANRRYLYFASKADVEGYNDVSAVFRSTAEGETGHAFGHLEYLEQVGDPDTGEPIGGTQANLKSSIAGETYEVTTMYPDFMKVANTAGEQLSLVSLNYAYKTEQKHKSFYEKALASLANGSVKSLPKVYYVCPVCGNTYENEAPQRCGISMTPNERFVKITDLNS